MLAAAAADQNFLDIVAWRRLLPINVVAPHPLVVTVPPKLPSAAPTPSADQGTVEETGNLSTDGKAR